MKTLEYSLCFTENTVSDTAVPAVIVAAGSSTRMKGINKPFATACGIPVIARTLLAFERSPYISGIVLVTKPDFVPDMQKICEEYMISKVTDIVAGGENRAASVLCGINCLKGAKKALVHDGARPLVSQALIERVCKEIANEKCVICGVKVKDTIKKVGESGYVKETYNRDELFCVQTPQGVDVEEYLPLLEGQSVAAFTDDASVFEAAGVPVKTVEGEYTNIKITTPEDIALAQYYISEMGENI
ncbi:MAG: 2-C-methyl-D-erythritol 4-phosphate cytidylyltransferase [Clostridia bacterium]|nr:2-C-methyl-D-erythritol 4-phosphate cytidylyltransferase [Clostridia bacterium]